eukprot:1249040-Pyramimonas_sp.AAC.1
MNDVYVGAYGATGCSSQMTQTPEFIIIFLCWVRVAVAGQSFSGKQFSDWEDWEGKGDPIGSFDACAEDVYYAIVPRVFPTPASQHDACLSLGGFPGAGHDHDKPGAIP